MPGRGVGATVAGGWFATAGAGVARAGPDGAVNALVPWATGVGVAGVDAAAGAGSGKRTGGGAQA